MPFELQHLLEWYYELSSRRQVTMAGVQAISYQEIHAWMICTERRLSKFDVGVITHLDDIYRSEAAERSREDSRRRDQKSKSSSGRNSGGEW